MTSPHGRFDRPCEQPVLEQKQVFGLVWSMQLALAPVCPLGLAAEPPLAAAYQKTALLMVAADAAGVQEQGQKLALQHSCLSVMSEAADGVADAGEVSLLAAGSAAETEVTALAVFYPAKIGPQDHFCFVTHQA